MHENRQELVCLGWFIKSGQSVVRVEPTFEKERSKGNEKSCSLFKTVESWAKLQDVFERLLAVVVGVPEKAAYLWDEMK
jgi:hypothetical protein